MKLEQAVFKTDKLVQNGLLRTLGKHINFFRKKEVVQQEM